VVPDRVFRVSGHEEYLQVRQHLGGACGQKRPGHAWHHHIRDQQIDTGRRVGMKNFQRPLAALGPQHAKAVRREAFRDQSQYVFIVFGDQYRLVPRTAGSVRALATASPIAEDAGMNTVMVVPAPGSL